MSRKVLFVATVLRMHVLVFHLPYMRWFQEQGYEVHLCCANDTPDPHPQVPYCDRWVELPFSPLAVFRRQPRGLSPPEAAHRRRGLRPHPLQHAGGRAVGPSGGACGAQTRHACGLYGARVSFFHRRAAEKLAAVLPRGASAQPLDRPAHHHQRRGLCPREAVCRRPRGAGQRRGGGPCALPRAGGPCRGACRWASARRTPCSSPWASTASERTTKP